MKRLTTLIGLLALAACSSSRPPATNPQQAQQPQQPWISAPPVFALIGEREEYQLTSEQITSLDSIGVALQTQNSPLQNQLMEMQPSGGIRRRQSQEDIERIRPLVDQIRENNRRAQEAVRAVLTEQQQRRVCERFGQNRGSTDPSRRRAMEEQARRNQRVRPGFGMDTTAMRMGMGRARVWTWCGQPTPAANAARPDSARADSVRADTTARVPVRP
ncbi:MAG TPA: hypothetical protein VHG28_07340 [Longimicrobiaceae bacterium]|nr:hypothetical protein [Longimicrobiaceae bacterium]